MESIFIALKRCFPETKIASICPPFFCSSSFILLKWELHLLETNHFPKKLWMFFSHQKPRMTSLLPCRYKIYKYCFYIDLCSMFFVHFNNLEELPFSVSHPPCLSTCFFFLFTMRCIYVYFCTSRSVPSKM